MIEGKGGGDQFIFAVCTTTLSRQFWGDSRTAHNYRQESREKEESEELKTISEGKGNGEGSRWRLAHYRSILSTFEKWGGREGWKKEKGDNAAPSNCRFITPLPDFVDRFLLLVSRASGEGEKRKKGGKQRSPSIGGFATHASCPGCSLHWEKKENRETLTKFLLFKFIEHADRREMITGRLQHLSTKLSYEIAQATVVVQHFRCNPVQGKKKEKGRVRHHYYRCNLLIFLAYFRDCPKGN